MSKSTPADLAVAFRSLARREREAVDEAEGAPVGDLLGRLRQTVAQAATLVGSAPEAGAVADAIDARPADAWDVATLDVLRQHATTAGTILREVASRRP
jgi:hypothetical protein